MQCFDKFFYFFLKIKKISLHCARCIRPKRERMAGCISEDLRLSNPILKKHCSGGDTVFALTSQGIKSRSPGPSLSPLRKPTSSHLYFGQRYTTSGHRNYSSSTWQSRSSVSGFVISPCMSRCFLPTKLKSLSQINRFESVVVSSYYYSLLMITSGVITLVTMTYSFLNILRCHRFNS